MKKLSSKNRKELKNKMAKVLGNKIQTLSLGMQDILLDDLITAFESRIIVLNQAQSSLQCVIDFGVEVKNEQL
jgi:hypothetical protein